MLDPDSPAVNGYTNSFPSTEYIQGNLDFYWKAHKIVKYLKSKRMNPSVELKELVLDKAKFRNKALLKETLIIDGLKQN